MLFLALEAGGISDVVRDKDGYHLIQLRERVRAAVIPFETAKEKLRQRLAFERGQARLKEMLGELERQAKVEIDEAALAGIKLGRPGGDRHPLPPPAFPGDGVPRGERPRWPPACHSAVSKFLDSVPLHPGPLQNRP